MRIMIIFKLLINFGFVLDMFNFVFLRTAFVWYKHTKETVFELTKKTIYLPKVLIHLETIGILSYQSGLFRSIVCATGTQ